VPVPELVLASTSPYRRELLDRLGLPYRALAPRIDERAVEPVGASPEDVALTLALAKARSVAPLAPSAFVLGSDQVVDVDGEILGKPGTPERAVAQLERLAGRTHRIITAVALLDPAGDMSSHVDVHRMRMRVLSHEALAAYVARDNPVDCAGAYKIEGRGLALFESIEGADYTAVIGLPLLAVVTLLEQAGIGVVSGAVASHFSPAETDPLSVGSGRHVQMRRG
jgi:septum formation protein